METIYTFEIPASPTFASCTNPRTYSTSVYAVSALFRLSLWLIIWFLHRVDVGDIADVSEVYATSMFDTEVGGNVYIRNPRDVLTQQQN
jgi:hypothetical protein